MREWLAAAIGSLLVLGSSGGQGIQERGRMPERERPASTTMERPASSTPGMKNVDFACVGAAVATRESTLNAALTVQQQAITAAHTARATALASAYTGTDKETVKTAVKKAWSDFATAAKNAKQTAERSKKNAWETFRTTAKSCKGGESIADSQNAGQEQL